MHIHIGDDFSSLVFSRSMKFSYNIYSKFLQVSSEAVKDLSDRQKFGKIKRLARNGSLIDKEVQSERPRFLVVG